MLTRIRATVLVAVISVVGLTGAGCSRGTYLAPAPRDGGYYENDGNYNNGDRNLREDRRVPTRQEGRHEEHDEHEGHR